METPTNAQSPMYLDVIYNPGITVYGQLRARLVWTKDDKLSLTTVEGTPETPIYNELFNVPIGEIVKISSIMDEIRIVTPQGKFRVSVAANSTPAIAAGGVAGAAVAYGMYKKSGADKWIERFRAHGVAVSRLGYGAVYAFAGGIAVLLIAIIIVIVALTQ